MRCVCVWASLNLIMGKDYTRVVDVYTPAFVGLWWIYYILYVAGCFASQSHTEFHIIEIHFEFQTLECGNENMMIRFHDANQHTNSLYRIYTT